MHELVVAVAKYFIVLSVIGALYLFFTLKNKDKRIFLIQLVVGGIIALVIAYLARKIYTDPRPFVVGHFTPYISHAPDNGFVSDHTLLASFLAFSCLFYNRWVGIALLVLAFDIGAARVAAGVHHWLDIVSAAVVSLISALIAYLITRGVSSKSKKTSSISR